MKKEFEMPTCDVVVFDNEDVITTSGNGNEDGQIPGGF